MDVGQACRTARSIVENVGRVVVGRERAVRLTVAALLARGHVLLEDVPGTGKTTLAKALASSMDASFSRIQFTPDLLPSDVTGMDYYDQSKGQFVFRPGPVFANVLLADEVNRATPRTQSALLECMEERQVTVDGVTRRLASPYLVIATQNPVETAGTFPLPEAQLDRFAVRLSLGLPDKAEELAILERFAGSGEGPLAALRPVCSAAEVSEAQDACDGVFAHPDVLSYIADVARAARAQDGVATGPSPRGTLALLRVSRALALMDGRAFVTPEDVKECAVPVLAHRMALRAGAPAAVRARDLAARALASVAVPTEDWGR